MVTSVSEQGKPRHIITLLGEELSSHSLERISRIITSHGMNIDMMMRAHFVTRGSSSNYGQLDDPELAEMIQQMRTTLDQDNSTGRACSQFSGSRL